LLNYTITPIILLPVYGVFRLFRLDTDTQVTQQDVMDLVEDADNNVIDHDQKEMIENIFLLENMTAGDIMTHRTEVFAVSGDEKCSDVIERAKAEGFSRIPVYSHTIDTIAGILYAKDLLNVVGDQEKLEMPIRDFVRKAMFVPEACAANELLMQFKIKHTQIAVVVDEYGGTSGIVTMEDVLEEIVGNIQDEYDNEEEQFIVNEDGSYLCVASMDLEDLLDLFSIDLPENFKDEEDFDTVGGLIIDRLARIPSQEENAKVEYLGLLFTVSEVADRRIVRVRVERSA
ncbi:MAG: hemolysin family protein, partial [Oscillospiraceae bacterium]